MRMKSNRTEHQKRETLLSTKTWDVGLDLISFLVQNWAIDDE